MAPIALVGFAAQKVTTLSEDIAKTIQACKTSMLVEILHKRAILSDYN